MVVYYLIKIVLYLLEIITSPLLLLPVANLSSSLTSALTTAGNYLAIFDIFVPLGTLFTVVGLMLGIEAGYFTYKGIKWLYNKIPGVN